MLDWIKQGEVYSRANLQYVPDHPHLNAAKGNELCITNFPIGQVSGLSMAPTVGTGEGQLLPGTYRYYDRNAGERVSNRDCHLTLNDDDRINKTRIALPYGDPFKVTLHTDHGRVWFLCTDSWLVRIGN